MGSVRDWIGMDGLQANHTTQPNTDTRSVSLLFSHSLTHAMRTRARLA